MGVLEREDGHALIRRLRARSGGRAKLLRGDPSGVPRKPERHESGVRRSSSVLVDEHVRGLLRDEDVAGATVELEGDLVRHRRRRQEQRRLLAEQRCDALLQRRDSRVLALLLVSDLRVGNRPSHAGRGLRHRVGAQVDHAAHATVRPWISRSSNARSPRAASPRTAHARCGSGRRVASPPTTGMTTLPKALRAGLAEVVPFSTLELVTERESRDGTVKALFRTGDGHPVEAVLMRYRDGRRSLCLSAQSGCPLTCTFCATGAMQFGRNLTAFEILDQALHFRRKRAGEPRRLHGDGRAVPELRRGARLGAPPARPRDHAPAYDDLDGRLDARAAPLRRRRGRADPARPLDPRRRPRPSVGADAGQRPLSAGRTSSPSAAATSRYVGGRCSSSTSCSRA